MVSMRAQKHHGGLSLSWNFVLGVVFATIPMLSHWLLFSTPLSPLRSTPGVLFLASFPYTFKSSEMLSLAAPVIHSLFSSVSPSSYPQRHYASGKEKPVHSFSSSSNCNSSRMSSFIHFPRNHPFSPSPWRSPSLLHPRLWSTGYLYLSPHCFVVVSWCSCKQNNNPIPVPKVCVFLFLIFNQNYEVQR